MTGAFALGKGRPNGLCNRGTQAAGGTGMKRADFLRLEAWVPCGYLEASGPPEVASIGQRSFTGELQLGKKGVDSKVAQSRDSSSGQAADPVCAALSAGGGFVAHIPGIADP